MSCAVTFFGYFSTGYCGQISNRLARGKIIRLNMEKLDYKKSSKDRSQLNENLDRIDCLARIRAALVAGRSKKNFLEGWSPVAVRLLARGVSGLNRRAR